MNRHDHVERNQPPELPSWLSLVRKTAASLRFGIIQIKVHNGEIVQIETTQKLRLDDLPPEPQLPPTEHSEAHPTKLSKANSHRTTGSFAKELKT